MPDEVPTNRDWFARRGATSVEIVRRVPCVMCCARKRHRCQICFGTGIRDAVYEIGAEDASGLAADLLRLVAEAECKS